MIRIENIEIFRRDLSTRMPFRYGIAEMRNLPHLLLRIEGVFDNRPTQGFAADHLPPKWFKKDPTQPPGEEIDEMLDVVFQAADAATGVSAASAFEWWVEAAAAQRDWARARGIPPLLAHFGVTLIERAVIDAAGRAAGLSFHRALVGGALGFNPAVFHRGWERLPWTKCLRPSPLSSCRLRHTIGLSDPIFAAELEDHPDRCEDGLPQALDQVIRHYGVTDFKIKIGGDLDHDINRIRDISTCLEETGVARPRFSLDGNEQFRSRDAFDEHWARLRQACPILRDPAALLWIEQPLHRDGALDDASAGMDRLAGAPPVIIDESDAEIDSLQRALDLGYAGTSHKNCKGIFKGLHHTCMIARKNGERDLSAPPLLMSGEDLSTIGPISLVQDLAVQAVLGIESVERNGHHYFRGLRAFPRDISEWVVAAHPDLYQWDPSGTFALLRPENGRLDLRSVNKAALGLGGSPDLDFAERIFPSPAS